MKINFIIKMLFYLQLFALAWSRNGSRLATFSKDHRLRVFEPRCSCSAVVEGEGPVGSRGARILWLNENTLFVSGFNKYIANYAPSVITSLH